MINLANRSTFPDRLVARALRVAAPRNPGPVRLLVTDSLRTERFEANAWTVANPAIVEVAVNTKLPYPWFHRHAPEDLALGSLSFGWLLGPEEFLVGLLAHELRHAYQVHHGQPLSERDADLWALSRIDRWRAC